MKQVICFALFLLGYASLASDSSPAVILDPLLIQYVFDKNEIEKRVQVAIAEEKIISFDGDNTFFKVNPEVSASVERGISELKKNMTKDGVRDFIRETIITSRYNDYIKLHPDKICNSKSIAACTEAVVRETQTQYGLEITGLINFLAIAVQNIGNQKRNKVIDKNEAAQDLLNYSVFTFQVSKNANTSLRTFSKESLKKQEANKKIIQSCITKTSEIISKTLQKHPHLERSPAGVLYKSLKR
jgi:hypothetical protein